MIGAVVENVSGRKLAILASIFLSAQLAAFLVGGLIAPAPANVENALAVKCIDRRKPAENLPHKWFYSRGKDRSKLCTSVDNFQDPIITKEHIMADQIVFSFQLPLPKGDILRNGTIRGAELDYSRWMQNLIGILDVDIIFKENNELGPDPVITMLLDLGYRNKGDREDDWKRIANSTESRRMDCDIKTKKENYIYNCTSLPLFELGSLHHDHYLLNIRLPIKHGGVTVNDNVGNIDDLWLVVINQNGGFTKVWTGMKTVFFPIVIAVMIWFWRRIKLLPRPPTLLERSLMALGTALSLLNLPLEFLSLFIDMPFNLILSDLRQGIFYAVLLGFWLIFAGEHLMDEVPRNSLRSYSVHLGAVFFGCLCLFVFDLCERGTQLANPFYSIWQTEAGTNIALGFIILAAISACIYFFFLSYMVYSVFQNISAKRSALPSMSSLRRMHYEGVIYRFKFLMLFTLLCAAMTVISFIVGQVAEGRWKWDEEISLQYTSAFFTGVYGMWNIYVTALLALYAPSHKKWPDDQADPTVERENSQSEEIEFARFSGGTDPSEVSTLANFMQKSSID